jgi:AcrR family transcriptional regulator
MNVRSNIRRGRPTVDDKRRRVLDAALAMFAERGYHGTAMPDVAATAGVATGTLYHYFEDKAGLVNELYRDAKLKLRAAMIDGLVDPDVTRPGAVEAWFRDLWANLATYAQSEPQTFRFLEMHDHIEYLDPTNRQLEVAVLAPVVKVALAIRERAGGSRIDLVMSLLWGAFVGLVKAHRLGYVQIEDGSFDEARELVWRMYAPEVTRAFAA